MLREQVGSARTKDAARRPGGDDRVVELAGDRDEVRHQVERQREVPDESVSTTLLRRGTRGSRRRRRTKMMQSGMNVTSARASSRRPTTTSAATAAAYTAAAVARLMRTGCSASTLYG